MESGSWPRDCIYCGSAPATENDRELCGSCFWSFQAELAEGFAKLGEYLAAHGRFAAWLRENGSNLT